MRHFFGEILHIFISVYDEICVKKIPPFFNYDL